MKFCTVNLGCKVNRVETDQAASLFLSCGFTEVPEVEAELVLVNTCTVTGEAEKKTRKAVRHALRSPQVQHVLVTGCASELDTQTYADMDARVEVIPKVQLMSTLEQRFASALGCEAVLRTDGAFRTRVGVKVQDGCNNACTFCIVHVARGRALSRPFDQVVSEVKELAFSGAKEIVLTGINLGSYHYRDEQRTIDLADLLSALMDETKNAPGGAPRFRISSIEPRNVDDKLIACMAAADGRICRHLHLPLQAGSTKVLKEMARPYTAEFFLELVDRLRQAMPNVALSTDIIAGFPGETEEEFRETLAVARQARFVKIHAFPYSLRAGTPAAARPDQVSPAVKNDRAERLRHLSDELCELDLQSRHGQTEWALVEPGGICTTESYHVMPAPQGSAVGELVRVAL